MKKLLLTLTGNARAAGHRRHRMHVDPLRARPGDHEDFRRERLHRRAGQLGFHGQIVPADSYSVSVTANENLFKYIRVARSGSVLRIEISGVRTTFGPTTLEAHVTMPQLYRLNLSGASRATARGFKSSHDFALDLSGASTADLSLETGPFNATVSGASRVNATVTSSDARIDVSGASRAEIDGSGKDLVLSASGASTANLDGFSVANANVNLSGASHGTITMNGRLDVDLSGASTLVYSGNVTLGRSSVTGASTLRQQS